MKNYYDILNIKRTATEKEIKGAYRQAVLFWHPDKNNSPNAHDKFIEINEAYNILIDVEKRKTYDYLYDLSQSSTEIITKNEDYKTKSKSYEEWISEARIKAEKLSTLSIDDVLTDAFHFIDRYGCLIITLIFFIGMIIILATTSTK